MIGLLTPPVGLILFVVAKIADIGIGEMVRAILPFLATLVIVLLLITIFPSLVLFLPQLLY